MVEVPGLAALFDRMTDHSPTRRYTAEQSLMLFNEILSSIPKETFEARFTAKSNKEAGLNDDYCWSKLSAEERSAWERYRSPRPPFFHHVLDFITDFTIGFKLVAFVRRLIRK